MAQKLPWLKHDYHSTIYPFTASPLQIVWTGRLIFYHYWCWRTRGAATVKTSTGNNFPRKYQRIAGAEFWLRFCLSVMVLVILKSPIEQKKKKQLNSVHPSDPTGLPLTRHSKGGLSTPNVTGRRFHRRTEIIPLVAPWGWEFNRGRGRGWESRPLSRFCFALILKGF